MENISGFLIVGLLFFAGILFLSGHGWQLIAGYNLASDEKKARYDIKRLYLVNGAGALLLGFLCLLAFFFSDQWAMISHILLIGSILLTLVGIVILNSTWCIKNVTRSQ
ncbi:DUF3784 domain-containing protein [Enterococcus sp.]|mgnify:CR=1 FL=1|uniref:DUF3784 domain-containing protein n=1 Tax=Enterococcus sp. TaxID=35783 RepID=UPI0025B94CD2|nr:DUF3784 domain-containing protein [Enterococcus sp.]